MNHFLKDFGRGLLYAIPVLVVAGLGVAEIVRLRGAVDEAEAQRLATPDAGASGQPLTHPASPRWRASCPLTEMGILCIQFRMTKVLTVRIDPALLEKAEARAAELGVERAQYVRSLIEEDLAMGAADRESRFVSSDLVGIFAGDGRSATNLETRRRLRGVR